MHESKPSRYVWGRIRSNRHKVGKARAASEQHLTGRKAQILLDLSEIREQFPNGEHQIIEDDIEAEVALIETELAARERGVRQSANPKLADFEYTHVFDDVDSYEQLNAEYDESSEWGYE